MPDATFLTLLFILPFAGCLLTAFFPSNTRNIEAWIAGAVALGGLVLTISLYPSITGGGSVRAEAEWLPALGIGVTIRMDGIAWMFALLFTGIGLLVMIYARYYLSPDDRVGGFFSFLLGFRSEECRVGHGCDRQCSSTGALDLYKNITMHR